MSDATLTNAQCAMLIKELANNDEFRRRYFAELRSNPAVQTLHDLIGEGPVTLLYGAHDEIHNQAVALAEFLTTKSHHTKGGR